jgi:asparagine synthase (glutamine-hydrolysing)
MCGIAGIWTNTPEAGRIRMELDDAVTRLRHRGPDDSGVWINDIGVGLGHTRLSILDLSALGRQPMVSPDGRQVIVFNGEVYNFAELRTELQRAGHVFRSTGDTEVILHAFREWGVDAVKKFVGMFAIALWDETAQTLHLMRDRIGVKPLYFGWDGATLCFGSELKALRAFRHWDPSIARHSLGEYLQYGYISEDRTIYQGVHKLKPGHRLTLKRYQQPIVEPYWSVLDSIDQQIQGTERAIELELEGLLIDCLRYRMVSDVPVGVYLSGGVDSSLVTALLAKHYDQPIRTFTIGFSEDSHDESQWARKVAQHCGTLHREYLLNVNEALSIAQDWGKLFDEPFGDSSGIPTLLVSRLAAEEVKVVLSADGGDELFSGYKAYRGVLDRLRLLSRVPPWLRDASSRGLSIVSPDRLESLLSAASAPPSVRTALVRKIRRARGMLGGGAGAVMDVAKSKWYPDQIQHLLGHYEPPRPTADCYPGTPTDQISLWDFHHYLPEDILTKVDRTTMACSIEGREPLLDHRLSEFAFRLPLHLRRGALGPKHILKSILYRYVPRELVDRPKQGFAIPLETWLRTDLKDLAHDYLAEDRIRNAGLMDPLLVRRVLRDFFGGAPHLTLPVWFLLAFEMWREHWGRPSA